jgi:hypothetical protein
MIYGNNLHTHTVNPTVRMEHDDQHENVGDTLHDPFACSIVYTFREMQSQFARGGLMLLCLFSTNADGLSRETLQRPLSGKFTAPADRVSE